ncbi:MAG: FtsQ-type POTRA domain-containing protein [Defluviitaleaceae bacterium]|nr:FtsQ-type POTRA domain-containing protein [Defluviitaleaceae bacterium]
MPQNQKLKKKKIISLPRESALLKVRPRVRFRRGFFSFFIIIVILSILYLATPVSRLGVIYFEGLHVLTRSELISLIEIEEDAFFIGIRLSNIRNRIMEHPVISQVNVSRAWMNRIRIEVVEYQVGACALVNGDVFHILTGGEMLHEAAGMRANCDEMMIHGLTSKEVDAGVPSLFVRQLMRVDPEIRMLIQMIEHMPQYGDIYRFSLSMIDGNVIKVTTHTMADELNLYPVILEGLALGGVEAGLTGTLYLDVGPVFVPHE